MTHQKSPQLHWTKNRSFGNQFPKIFFTPKKYPLNTIGRNKGIFTKNDEKFLFISASPLTSVAEKIGILVTKF